MALEQLRGVILVQSPWALHIRHVSRDIPGGDEVPVWGEVRLVGAATSPPSGAQLTVSLSSVPHNVP